MDQQIVTSAERTAPGEAEPKLTISQLQVLLREAAALERAQRPIVIRPAAETTVTSRVSSPASAPEHGGVDVRVPAALAVTVYRAHNPWPLTFMVSAVVGIGSCLVTAVTGSLIPMVVTLAAFAVWGVATYNIAFKEQ